MHTERLVLLAAVNIPQDSGPDLTVTPKDPESCPPMARFFASSWRPRQAMVPGLQRPFFDFVNWTVASASHLALPHPNSNIQRICHWLERHPDFNSRSFARLRMNPKFAA